ncbi:hypothetical protein [Sphingomonas lycopersici]|uniref:Uncharacterized protein n=1 Tax=Sphingomonas lycopersici TaxID=2951807 RepID=A0AA42CNP4_9SPHN|nr:hypothetical protein [Sphingomonas lycopersici]MCW6533539.1 hypothetical protein [Sphingomonas lycopersici]
MIIDRRQALTGLIAGAALSGAPAARAARGAQTVIVADLRLPAVRQLTAGYRPARLIDLSAAHADLWREMRGFVPGGARVIGVTRWSDWIAVRGLLIERGLRVRAERPLAAARAFSWEMS